MMNFRRLIVALLIASLWLLPGCNSKPQYPLPVTDIQIGGQTFNVEIAIDFKDQETGLMHRDHLAPDHGMIFISDRPKQQTFWNHDVHFPLDLLFLNETGDIVSIKHLKAWDDTNVPSDAEAMYVIELNFGTADRLKLKVGDHISLPPDVVHPSTIVSH